MKKQIIQLQIVSIIILVFFVSSCNKSTITKDNNSASTNSSTGTESKNPNKDYEAYINSLPPWKPGNNNTLSPAHKDIMKRIVQKPAPKGNSWKGHWMFIITPADGYTLQKGVTWQKNYYNAQGRVFKVDQTKPAPNEIEHIGFITLESATKGYDLTSYGDVKMAYYAMKAKGNRLVWNFAWLPSPKDNRDFKAQVFYREVEYDPSTDTLYGKVTSYLFREFKDGQKKALVPIPVCEYNFKASRLSEEDFQRIANSHTRNPEFPNYEYAMMVSRTSPWLRNRAKLFLKEDALKKIKVQAAKKRIEIEKQFLDKK